MLASTFYQICETQYFWINSETMILPSVCANPSGSNSWLFYYSLTSFEWICMQSNHHWNVLWGQSRHILPAKQQVNSPRRICKTSNCVYKWNTLSLFVGYVCPRSVSLRVCSHHADRFFSSTSQPVIYLRDLELDLTLWKKLVKNTVECRGKQSVYLKTAY